MSPGLPYGPHPADSAASFDDLAARVEHRLAATSAPDPDRREFDALPDEPARARWVRWLEQHGADPHRAVVPGWIERRLTARQLAYSVPDTDAAGDPALDDAGEFIHATEVIQLESPPAPFPDDDHGRPVPPPW